MSDRKEDPVKVAERLDFQLNEIDRRVVILLMKFDSGAELPRGLFVFGDRHKKLGRELSQYKEKIQDQRDELRRFYDLIGVNLDNATGLLDIVARRIRDLSETVDALEGRIAPAAKAPPKHETPASAPPKHEAPAVPSTTALEKPSGPPHISKEEPIKPEPKAIPVYERPREVPKGVQVAWATRNDRHGEDFAMELTNSIGDLHGIVICDGVTNANGGVASASIAKSVQAGFKRVQSSENLRVIRSQIDLLVQDASRQLGIEARSKGVPETATTILLAFADNRGLYVYYLGDGTVRQYSEDAYSVGDYLMTYGRGGALGGYISSGGIVSRPTFLYVDCPVTSGTFLVLATDGAELANLENHIALGTMLRDRFVGGKEPLRGVLEAYLDGLRDRIDDATVGVIWNAPPQGGQDKQPLASAQ